MQEIINNFVFTRQFIPHGHCYLWKPGLVWLHIVSDSLIALAYYAIPVMLIYFVRKRRDVPFDWIFLMFGTFIVACGTTHVMEVWTLWHPYYWLSGLLKAITAGVSLSTAVALVPLIPQALALVSPAQLQVANQALLNEIAERQRAEEALERSRDELEIRVAERTGELIAINESLKAEIAERQRVESALRESEQRYRFLAEAIPQIVWTTKPEGCADYFNQRWFEYTGMTLEQNQGRGWQLVVHPDDLHNTLECWSKALETGEAFEIEYRLKRASDGQYRWHLSRGLPMRDRDGRIVKWFGTCTDIEDRKQAEAKFRRIFECGMIGLFFWDADGNITDANDAFLKMVGYTRAELVEGAVSWKDQTPPEYSHQDLRAIAFVIATGSGTPYEKEYISKDGSRLPILMGGALLEGSEEQGICFILDISEPLRGSIKGSQTS